MRTKKAFRNLIFNLFQQIVGIITGFILPPLIIGNFGSAVNGTVATIRQLMSYVQLTGAGISSTATHALYEPIKDKNYKKLNGIYNAANKMFIRSGNIFSLIVLIASAIYPFMIDRQGVPMITVTALVIVMSISGLSEFYIFGKYQTLITADQNIYVVAIAQALGNIMNIAVSFILISLHQNIIVVQLGASIIYLARILVLHYYVKKHYKFLDPKVKPEMDALKQKNDAIIHELTALVVWNSSTILLSIMMNTKVASVYSVYALVFSGLNMICNIVANAIYASFGDVISRKENDTLQKAFNIYEWFYFLIVFIIYTVTFLLVMPFIGVYTAGPKFADVQYFLPLFGKLFVFVGIINNLRVPARTLVVASGHFKETRNRSLLEMIINIIGQVVGIHFFGIYGTMMGAILSFTYRSIDFLYYSNKTILKISNYRSIKRILINTIIAIIVVIALTHFMPLQISNYMSWIYNAVLVTILTSCAFVLVNFIFDRTTAIQTIQSIKNIIK